MVIHNLLELGRVVQELKEELKERLDVTYRRFEVNKRLKRDTTKLKKEVNILEIKIMLIKSVEEKMNNMEISSTNNYIYSRFKDESITYFAEIYYQINNVSRNKNNRDISFFLSVDSQVVKLDYLIAEILDMKMSKKQLNQIIQEDIKLRHRQI